MAAALIAGLLLLTPAVAQDGQCIRNKRGPACSNDSDCQCLTGCVRCARYGFCTDVPLGPKPPRPGPSNPSEGCTPANKSYDFLMLVQGWPESNCLHRHCKEAFQQLDYWVLHGLWPSRKGAAAASFPCKCDGRPFVESQVASIEEDLQKYWASFDSDEGFWEHEWTKHGTCCSDCPHLEDELSYFKHALALRKNHDIAAALQQASIMPDSSKQYTAQEILKALTPVGGFAPLLGCSWSGDVQILHEVTFCLDKALTDVNCDDSVRTVPHDEVSDCDLSKGMALLVPGSQPDSWIEVGI